MGRMTEIAPLAVTSSPSRAAGIRTAWVTIVETLKLAMDALRAHKLRSFLTLLGVIIGVASVIMVGAAIAGLGVYAEQSTAKAFGASSSERSPRLSEALSGSRRKGPKSTVPVIAPPVPLATAR